MKHIDFEAFLRRDFELSREIKTNVLNKIKDFNMFDMRSLEVEDVGSDRERDKKTLIFINNIICFTLSFIYNILHDNRSVRNNKENSCKIDIKIRVDFKSKKLQIYYYIDDDIFGIVVGKQFQNVRAFIQACFPIIAKSEFRMEFRFFPISRK